MVYIQTKCGPGNVVSFHLRNVEKAQQQQGQSVDENGEQQLRSPISPLDEKTLGSGSNWGSPYSTLRKTPNLSAYPSHLAYSPSSPSIPLRASTPNRAATAPPPLLSKYDPLYQKQLLRSHYSKSEVNFIQGLESISNRLLVVPKPARVSETSQLLALTEGRPSR